MVFVKIKTKYNNKISGYAVSFIAKETGRDMKLLKF